MNQRHLILAYAATWIIQLSYVGFLVNKWIAMRKTETKYPRYDEMPE